MPELERLEVGLVAGRRHEAGLSHAAEESALGGVGDEDHATPRPLGSKRAGGGGREILPAVPVEVPEGHGLPQAGAGAEVVEGQDLPSHGEGVRLRACPLRLFGERVRIRLARGNGVCGLLLRAIR